MPITEEPMRTGLDPEERKRIEGWLKSPEGQVAIATALRDIRDTIIEMRKAREIPLHLLHEPMDL